MIRFGQDREPVPINMPYVQETNDTWTLWSHAWEPARMGFYDITMHIDDASIRTWRLDRGAAPTGGSTSDRFDSQCCDT